MICFAGMTDFARDRMAHAQAIAAEATEVVVARQVTTVAVQEVVAAPSEVAVPQYGCEISVTTFPASEAPVAEEGTVTASLQTLMGFTDVMAAVRNSADSAARAIVSMDLGADDPNPQQTVASMITSIGSLDLAAPAAEEQPKVSATPYFDAFYQKCVTAFTLGEKPFWEPMIGASDDGLKTDINGHMIIVCLRGGKFYVHGPQALVTAGLIPPPNVGVRDEQLSGLFGPEANQSMLHVSIAAILKAFAPDVNEQPINGPVSMARELRPYLLQRFDKLWDMSPSNSDDPTQPIRDSRQGGRGLYLDVTFGGLQVFEVANSPFLDYEAPEGLVMSGWLKEKSGVVTNDLFDLFFGDEAGQKKNLAIAVRDRLADAERRFTRQH